ncbi:MAG TPA: NifU family protein [Terriglobia bacterium]|jgi:Fe-S cluster biogenesis protein NfuA
MNGELNDRIRKIDELIAQIQAAPDPQIRDAALQLVQILMDFHAAGIDRMMELTSDAGDAGWRLIDQLGSDELVANMLLLHGLHPLDLDTRVRDALDRVRPDLQSHGGDVELLEIAGGIVRLNLLGSCDGCPSSAVTLKTAIEKAIYETAPDVISVECDTVSRLVGIQNAI